MRNKQKPAPVRLSSEIIIFNSSSTELQQTQNEAMCQQLSGLTARHKPHDPDGIVHVHREHDHSPHMSGRPSLCPCAQSLLAAADTSSRIHSGLTDAGPADNLPRTEKVSKQRAPPERSVAHISVPAPHVTVTTCTCMYKSYTRFSLWNLTVCSP